MNIIVTHPGGAHKDDFLACCLLIHAYGAPVFRREPTAEDIENPLVCVVDVGGEHDPEKLNFDHHQFAPDHVPTCALSLVLMHLGLYEDARAFCDWLEPAEWFDTRGPVKTAKWLGIERDQMSKLISPIDMTVLRRFAKESELAAGHPIWELMWMIGDDLVHYVKGLRQRLDEIEEVSEVWDLGGGLKVLFMPRTDPMGEEPSSGLGRYIDMNQLECVGMVYPDRRGDGFGLTRFNDDLRLDFTRVESEPDVHFAHRAGFVAKSSATGEERLKQLLLQAWIG